jgi:hypothetical protein
MKVEMAETQPQAGLLSSGRSIKILVTGVVKKLRAKRDKLGK